jgi:predicted acyl esterase
MSTSPTVTLPAKRRRIGAPSKYTPQTRARLVELVKKGVPFRHACNAVRISYQSFCDYREQHPDFREEIERGVSNAIEKHLDLISKAAETGDVQSSKWLLEHLHPEHFARNRIELTGRDGSPLTAAIGIYLPAKDQPEPVPVTLDSPPQVEDANG